MVLVRLSTTTFANAPTYLNTRIGTQLDRRKCFFFEIQNQNSSTVRVNCYVNTIRIRTIALICSCLFMVPFLSFAQAVPDPVATSPEKTMVASSSSESVPSLEELGLPPVASQNNAQAQSTSPNTAVGNANSQQTQQDQTKPGNAPSLGDLGFSSTQTQGSAQQQALLNKRTHMLKVHQTLGLITAIPMAATLISGPQAKAKGKNGQPIRSRPRRIWILISLWAA